VTPSAGRTASTSTSPGRTFVPGQSTDRTTVPSTAHPSPITPERNETFAGRGLLNLGEAIAQAVP